MHPTTPPGEPSGPDATSGQLFVIAVGRVAWSFVGVVVAVAILVALLATVSELVLPLVLAVMIGAVAHPLATRLQGRGMKPSLAAATVVLGAVAGGFALVLIVVDALVQETGDLAKAMDDALGELGTTTDGVGLDAATLEEIRAAVASIAGIIGRGLLTALVGGMGALFGFVAGTILALLILYYVLKDGPEIRSWLIGCLPIHLRSEGASFVAAAVRALRAYWAGRAVLSALVTVAITIVALILDVPLVPTLAVVTFIGGFIPYIGAFLGGALATLLALAQGGVGRAVVMLAVVLVANLLLENLLEPRIMSGRLKIHPLVVLIVTTLGGVVGGIVGLMVAVPATVVGIDLVRRLRTVWASGIATAPQGAE